MKQLIKRIIKSINYIISGTSNVKATYTTQCWLNPKKLTKNKWNFVSATVTIDEFNDYTITDIKIMGDECNNREFTISDLHLIKRII